MLINFGKIWNRLKIQQFEFYFRYNSFEQPKKLYCANKTKMPPKKSKRKAESSVSKSPVVKDPFSASKRSKNNNDEVIALDNDENIIESTLDLEISPKAEENDTTKSGKDASEENNSEKNNEEVIIGKSSTKTTKEDLPSKYEKEEFKKTSNGKDYNLKIVSWNINGIRAWLDKGGLDYLKAEDPDIFCCQETKCDKSKIPPKASLPGYFSYWLSGDTQGYSGVGLMTKQKPIKISYGMNLKKHDNEGRVVCAEYENFYLINTYIPNSGRGLVRLSYRMEWEAEFRKYLANLESEKPVIWTGDLNVAHNPIDIKNPNSNLKSAGFTLEERECFTKILSDGYFDSFRYLYPKKTDAFTYWSYFRNAREKNVGWRLDYFVMSEKLKPNLVDNLIRSKVMGSDHCPIALFLKFD